MPAAQIDQALPAMVGPDSEGQGRLHMRGFALLISVVLATVVLLNPALAKEAHRHPAYTNNQVAPPKCHIPRYDWQAGDCDVTNKTSLNTCTNGG
jgi:hypothetical protein